MMGGEGLESEYEIGARVNAKVVEAVIARLAARLAAAGDESAASATAAIAKTVEKTWRENYGLPLPTAEEAGWEKVRKRKLQELERVRKRNRVLQFQETREAVPRPAPRVSQNFGKPPTTLATVGTGVTPAARKLGIKRHGTKANKLVLTRKKRPRPTASGNAHKSNGHDRSSQRINGSEGTRNGNLEAAHSVDHASDTDARNIGRNSSGENGRCGSTGDDQGRQGASGRELPEGIDANGAAVNGHGQQQQQQQQQQQLTNVEDSEKDMADRGGIGSSGDVAVDDELAPPPEAEFCLTANYAGDIVRNRAKKDPKWRFVLDGGTLEGDGQVYVFEKCLCAFAPPRHYK